MNELTRIPAYGNTSPLGLHGRSGIEVPDDASPSGRGSRWVLSDVEMLALAMVTVVAVWTGSVVMGLATAGIAVIGARRLLIVALALVLVLAGVVRSDTAWEGLAPDRLGAYQGWALVVDDPQPYRASTRVIFEVDGERFETWSRGRAQQLRVREWRGGEWVSVSGERIPLDASRAGRVAWQHVVGEFELEWASDVAPGGGLARASNRIRAAIERAGTALPADDGALYRGLVVGDDRDQPREMIDRFRASGLSHLTAVSGQNVSFVLAACGPLLRRLRPIPRLVITVALILWFVTLTRFEPSIVRAGAMASLSAWGFATGRERAPLRILAVAVLALMLIDPLLHRSIGFWLSVGATAGVVAVGPWLAQRLPLPTWAGLPLGITLGAQVGVAVPLVLVFGQLPLVSVPANLLAVPVAGAVMLYGLPAGLVAGWLPALAPVVMAPVRFGTRWVDTVAMLGARLEPDAPWSAVGWVVLAVLVAATAWGSRHRARRVDARGDPVDPTPHS